MNALEPLLRVSLPPQAGPIVDFGYAAEPQKKWMVGFMRLYSWIYDWIAYPLFFNGILQGPPRESVVERLIPKDPGGPVLDLACGSGLITCLIAQQVYPRPVIGLDISLDMLERAHQRAQRLGLDNLTWIRGDAEQLPFKNASFHLAFNSNSLYFFPRPQQALQELHRVLKEGAPLKGFSVVRTPEAAWFTDTLNRLFRWGFAPPDAIETMVKAADFSEWEGALAGSMLLFSARR